MAILQTWRDLAYGEGLNDKERENLWSGYFAIEKGIYEQILSAPSQVIEGTVKELAEKYKKQGYTKDSRVKLSKQKKITEVKRFCRYCSRIFLINVMFAKKKNQHQ